MLDRKERLSIIEENSQKKFIETFLDKYIYIDSNSFIPANGIGNKKVTISDAGIIDVNGNITLFIEAFNKDKIIELPIQFGHVTGYFHFENSTLINLKGFPHTVDGDYFSVNDSKYLTSLKNMPKSKKIMCNQCIALDSLNGLNCIEFYGKNLNLKNIGTDFYAKKFVFNNFPTPTADEMRHFIQLNPQFDTNQKAPWIKLIQDYCMYKDLFKAVMEFEDLYQESYIKSDEIIILKNDFYSDKTLSF